MTVASINSTVTTTVSEELGSDYSDSYSSAIVTVSEALTEREYDIVETIVEAAHSKYGVSKRDATSILEQAGLSVRPAPVAVPEPVEEDEAVTADDVASGKRSKAERIAALEEGQAQIISTLDKLAQAVGGLTTLANRHLGSSL